ncbi:MULTISPECIES: hypothetical protein [Terrabacteria group]
MGDRERDEAHAFAVTVGLLLLIGGVLLMRQLWGVWAAFALAAAPVLACYLGPPIAREVAVRRFARQLRRR